MRLVRNTWLAGLTSEQFLNLDPWAFVLHDESNQQWIAEIRSKISVRLKDDEILQIVYPGLHDTTRSAIRNHGSGNPEGRGKCLLGYALAYLRKYGCALVIEETPGYGTYSVTDLDGLPFAPRAHGFSAEYHSSVSEYTDSLSAVPQFLSDGVVLSDEGLQERHRNIETLRRFLTPREHQILRLAVLEQHKSGDMGTIMGLGAKQVWKVRRALKRKLASIAIDQGACPNKVAALLGSDLAVTE
ncbi:helix-turn-helix domain-containing protein [Pseudomonas guariconensis]|uniref:hypothetical protein n=1 Tax=Pseudomonas guariconensis TaxID=1288410 RepID=UPI0039062AC7